VDMDFMQKLTGFSSEKLIFFNASVSPAKEW
jgi:hypothetical protein